MVDDDLRPELVVGAIHNEQGYQSVRDALSRQYNLGHLELDIQVVSVDIEGSRALTLHYTQQDRVPLSDAAHEVLKHLHTLWQFPVILKAIDAAGLVTAEYHCPSGPTP